MKNYKIFFIILLLIIFSCPEIYSQKLIRHVIGSGGMPVQGNGVEVNCTIGQTHIGLVKSTPSDTLLVEVNA